MAQRLVVFLMLGGVAGFGAVFLEVPGMVLAVVLLAVVAGTCRRRSDLVRVGGQLQDEGWSVGHQAYFVIDEFSALGPEGRHVVPVLARAREAGIGWVVA